MRFSRYNNENDHGNILATDPELSAESGQESDDEFRPIIPSDIETVSHYIFDIHDTDEQSLRYVKILITVHCESAFTKKHFL